MGAWWEFHGWIWEMKGGCFISMISWGVGLSLLICMLENATGKFKLTFKGSDEVKYLLNKKNAQGSIQRQGREWPNGGKNLKHLLPTCST
jgi:hypothetical protein